MFTDRDENKSKLDEPILVEPEQSGYVVLPMEPHISGLQQAKAAGILLASLACFSV